MTLVSMAPILSNWRITRLVDALLIALWVACHALPAFGQEFHSGGVGSCNGCHIMHGGAPTVGQPLLLQSDASSICLNCHAGPGGPNSPNVLSPDGSALTPGGDFYWLSRDFSWLSGNSPGYEHGHNIVAINYSLQADPLHTQSPGGSFPSTQLGCTSCHDPHGRVSGGTLAGSLPVEQGGSYGAVVSGTTINGNYRLLGGVGYQPPGGARFVNNAPTALQSNISKYLETYSTHVDYGSGMSDWCGNCHADIANNRHKSSPGGFKHSTNQNVGGNFMSMYNSYINSGDASGNTATAYLQFVPFERGTDDLLLLDPNSTLGMDSRSRITCLTCHRAHASAFPAAGRWDFKATLLVESHPANGDAGTNPSDKYYSYYGRDITAEFGSGQGSFCEKCHGSPAP